MLARRCLAKALYGEVLLLPVRPSVVMDMPRLCAGAGIEDGTEDEVGEVETAAEDTLRGLNSSAKEERRPPEAPGDGGGDWLAIEKNGGQSKGLLLDNQAQQERLMDGMGVQKTRRV
jgi:hypothetical protein